MEYLLKTCLQTRWNSTWNLKLSNFINSKTLKLYTCGLPMPPSFKWWGDNVTNDFIWTSEHSFQGLVSSDSIFNLCSSPISPSSMRLPAAIGGWLRWMKLPETSKLLSDCMQVHSCNLPYLSLASISRKAIANRFRTRPPVRAGYIGFSVAFHSWDLKLF